MGIHDRSPTTVRVRGVAASATMPKSLGGERGTSSAPTAPLSAPDLRRRGRYQSGRVSGWLAERPSIRPTRPAAATGDRVHNDPRQNEVEIMDGGTDGGLLPSVPSGWNDALTGTDGPRLWDRVISSEVARVNRYARPATVVLIEFAGLDVHARMMGRRRLRASLHAARQDPRRRASVERSHREDRSHPLRDPADRDRRDRGHQHRRARPSGM